MIISYSRPKLTWTLTGATALTDVARLTNGRATSACRIDCGGDSSGEVTMAATFGGSQIVPKLAGIIGTSLAAGTNVTCSYIRTGDAGYGYQSQTLPVIVRRDGVRVVWFALPDDVDACYGVQFSFDATAQIDSGGLILDFGEIWVGPGASLCITPSYAAAAKTHSDLALSVNGQPFRVVRQTSTEHNLTLRPYGFDDVFGAPGTDIESIRQACSEYAPCAVVPMTREAFSGRGAMDSAIINRQAAFGYVQDIGGISASHAPYFDVAMKFIEIPAYR